MNLTGSSFSELQAALQRLRHCSIPQLLRERVQEEPQRVAVRYKRNGVFYDLVWREYQERIRLVAAGLIEAGVTHGSRVAIMGDVCIEYLLADLASTFIGAIPCGVYPTSSPEEVAYVLRLSGARTFIAEDQEHLDRLLAAEATANAPLVDKIIVCDERALFLYEDPRIEPFTSVFDRGSKSVAAQKKVGELENKVSSKDVSAIIFTSGTTGFPKAAYRTQASDLIGFGYSFIEAFPELCARPHRVVCQLPLAHGMGRATAIYAPLVADIIPHIGEPNQSLISLMNEVRPTYAMGVPRTWEKICGHVQVSVASAGFLARNAFAMATALGRQRVRHIWQNGKAPLYIEAIYWPLWAAILWPALHKMGLTYAVGASSGGAPLPPAVHETLQAWGIPLRDMFGMTETGGIGSQASGWPPPEAPIKPIASCEIKLGSDGELFLRSFGNVSGYWNDESATKDLFDKEGFVRSGDIATVFENGAFRIVDRKKDILITSGGKNIAPAAVENALRCSPYISEVIVFGDKRKYVTALVEIDFENVAQWARERQIAYTGYFSLTQNEKVIGLIAQEIEKLNERLARVEQVKKFNLLPKELVPEDGDTTPTRKIKRTHALRLFGDLVEEMYAGGAVSEVNSV
jgi:long-chain acyl-CoA synthetase